MLNYCILFFALLYALSGNGATTMNESEWHALCPVSHRVDQRGDFFYPVFYLGARMSALTIPCFDKDANYASSVHSCPLDAHECPIRSTMPAHLTAASMNWVKATTLCSLKRYLSNSNGIARMIVMGDSIPFGVLAEGCCRRPECQQKDSVYCTWHRHLFAWLNDTSAARVEWINMARGGQSSHLAVAEWSIAKFGVTEFSGRDVIFLDHSHNDFIRTHEMGIDLALETLIRKILLHSVSRSDLPTIILTDTSSRNGTMDGVTSAYRRIAAHYGIRLYSFYDAVHSLDPSDPTFKYLSLHRSVRVDHHPPWHLHLYMADLFATALSQELDQCSEVGAAVARSEYVLPPPLVKDTMSLCEGPPLLDVSYDGLVNKSLPSAGEMIAASRHSWQVRTDRKGRGGIINELSASTSCNQLKEPLIFRWGLTVAEARERNNLKLQIVFQRSYWNAGRVRLTYCGRLLGYLDALWSDYRTFHFTLPFVYNVQLSKHFCRRTVDGPAEVVLTQESDGCDVEQQPRQRQMFKLLSVKVCEVSSNDRKVREVSGENSQELVAVAGSSVVEPKPARARGGVSQASAGASMQSLQRAQGRGRGRPG